MSSSASGYRVRTASPWPVWVPALLVLVLAGAPAGGQGTTAVVLEKTGALDDGGDGATPGDLIEYSFVVTNTDMYCDAEDATLSDPLISDIDCGGGTGLIGTVAAGGMASCTGTYAISQDDIDIGGVYNSATLATLFCGEEDIEVTDDHTEPIPQTPAIELDKVGTLDLGGDGVATPGDLISYELVVTNSGNVTLNSATLTDPELADIACPGGHPIVVLAPGEMETCTGSYELTQEDIDAGEKSNTAEVSAIPGLASPRVQVEPVTAEDTETVEIPQVISLEVDKLGSLDLGGDGVASPGDVIDYDFEVSNTGNVTLQLVTLSDPMVTLDSCPVDATLAPGEAIGCTGTYAITQDDIDAGEKENTAQADAIAPDESPVQGSATHVQFIPVGGIELIKSGTLDLGGDGVATPGDLITYELAVFNTGNVALHDVTLSDPLLAGFDCPSGHPIAVLGVSTSETCTGSYAITQEDIDRGSRENTAEVTADEAQAAEAPVSRASAQATTEVLIPQGPAIELAKSGVGDFGADGVPDVGEEITYTLVVANPGNVTLADITVSDPLVATVDCPSGNPIPSLAPGADESCTAVYALTAADLTAGSVENTAEAAGEDPSSRAISDSDSETVDLPAAMPTLGALALMALAAALLAAGALTLRRRQAAR